MLIAHYFLSQTLTLNVYVRQKSRKMLMQRWMPTEISMQAISLHTGYRRSRSKGKLAGQSIPSPDITKGKLSDELFSMMSGNYEAEQKNSEWTL